MMFLRVFEDMDIKEAMIMYLEKGLLSKTNDTPLLTLHYLHDPSK